MGIIEAEFDNGVLRPLARVPLRPGEHVGLVIVRRPDPERWNLAQLAAGRDEDEILTEHGLAEWADDLDREDRR